MAGRIGWVVGLPDRGNDGDPGVRLPRPDEPVRLLRVPAPDLRVEHRGAEQRIEVGRLPLGEAVRINAVGRDLEPESRGRGCTRALRPERSDLDLLGGTSFGDVPDLRQCRQEVPRPERRRRARPKLARRLEEPGTHAGQRPAADGRGGRVADPQPGAHRNGPAERRGEAVRSRSCHDPGAHRAADDFAPRKPGTCAPLCLHRVLERLCLRREQIAQHSCRRTRDGAGIGPITATPVPLAAFGPLHRQVLCDTEQGVRPRRHDGCQVGLCDQVCLDRLPPRTG